MGGSLLCTPTARKRPFGGCNARHGRRKNLVTHRVDVCSHAIVLEADHVEAQPAQFHGALDVSFTAAMLAAINLDNQVDFHANTDKAPDRMLPAKSKAADLALAEPPPKRLLGVDRLAAH